MYPTYHFETVLHFSGEITRELREKMSRNLPLSSQVLDMSENVMEWGAAIKVTKKQVKNVNDFYSC
jgi:hypothetical protein